MDLTVETRQYRFSASSAFDYITLFLINNLKKSVYMGAYYSLTKREVQDLIEYLKQNNYGDGRDFWIVDCLTSMEMLMEGKERATFHFW